VKTFLLFSGGLDSTLCLHKYDVELAVGFDYGQAHAIELEYAKKIADVYNVKFQIVRIPKIDKTDDLVFAGRNAILLSHAASIAQAEGLDQVMIGCNKSDAEMFPDCRPEFIASISIAFEIAYGVSISAPLLKMTKKEIKAESPFLDTWTCYQPKDGRPCGVCYSCRSLEC
jgi:7-cyano-7-deazaguanine synthase